MMAYVKQSWKDGKGGGTPISAARLNHIEDGIASVPAGPKGDAGAAGPKGDKGDAGPKGDKGDAGPKGDKGDTGAKGADGFPTEEQWNALVARVTALERKAGA
ncbi:hypothetical protein [Rothia koreensis]|uniref:hypothetical protein n=1 Tax=Rothia koreensis TaxID=592378 RepID=UPI003FCEA853